MSTTYKCTAIVRKLYRVGFEFFADELFAAAPFNE